MKNPLLPLLTLATIVAFQPPAQAASMFDPDIRWKTIATPHFRVNFQAGDEAIARKAAAYAEEAHSLLSPYLDETPKNPTELTLLDNEETVNGFGFPLPNNQIYVYLTSPPEDQLEGRYDAWLRDLLIHEYTHVLHLEKTAGLPAWINGFFGRSYFPNMFQPVFLIEGLAVHTETRFSTGGRGRESYYRALLRMAALEGRLASLEKASGYYVIDHPGGEIPYAYGMAFYRHLARRFGPDAPAAVAKRYAHYPFFGLYGLDETLKAVTGEDTRSLWEAMRRELAAEAEAELASIRKAGPLTPLVPVTEGGMHHRHPAYDAEGELSWAEWTGHDYPYLVTAKGRLLSKGPFGRYAHSPDGRHVYHARVADPNRFTRYADLFRFDRKTRRFEQLSERARLAEPAVSPDGRWLVSVKSGRGQTNMVKLRADGSGLRPLTADTEEAQWSGPVWHPHRHLVAASAWRDGARDLYLVDPESGRATPLWRDRALDLTPTWSPDGRYLVFSSDRTGVFNLYAHELETGRQFRITNVVGGVTEPAVSPDGKTIACVSYSSRGFDIATLPYAPAGWTPVPAPLGEAGLHAAKPAPAPYPEVAYSPWPSLRPKTWAPFSFFDDRGPVLGATTLGQDSLLQHFFYGAAGWGLLSGRPFYALSYTNDQLYPSISAYLSETTLVSRPFDAGTFHPVVQTGRFQGLSVTWPGLPSAFLQNHWVTGDTFAVGLNLAQVQDAAPVSAALPPSKRPPVGNTNTVSFTYKYGDNYKFAYSISPEGGNLVTLGYERALPVAGGTAFDRAWLDWRRYLALPWAHHVLALRASGGASNGAQAGQFYLGGFDSATLLANVDLRTASNLGTRQLPLRGYPLGAMAGPFGVALSAEYRFPLMSVQTGYGIYPVFLRNLHGAVFAETGQAWQSGFSWRNNLATAGAELRAQTHFMQAPTEIRVGLGQGLTPAGGAWPWPAVFVDLGTYF